MPRDTIPSSHSHTAFIWPGHYDRYDYDNYDLKERKFEGKEMIFLSLDRNKHFDSQANPRNHHLHSLQVSKLFYGHVHVHCLFLQVNFTTTYTLQGG